MSDGIGGTIFFIFLIVASVWGYNNYSSNTFYEGVLLQCQEFCENNSQEYYGVENIKESNRECVCNNSINKMYRNSSKQFKIIEVHNSSASGSEVNP